MRKDGAFAPVETLNALFMSLGLTLDRDIVVYGQFGTETEQVWLALRLAGYEYVRIYDDGWLAWGYDVRLPIHQIGPPPDAN